MIAVPMKDEEVADSTDWLPTALPKLSGLDSALRCQVCKDFYKTPVITSCSHTFCSLCIRRCLSNDGKCPLCRASDQEMKLRKNDAIEDAVEAFTAARQQIMDFVRQSASNDGLDKRKRGLEQEESEDPSSKRARRQPQRNTRAAAYAAQAIPDTDDDDIYEPEEEIREDGMTECPICSGRMSIVACQVHIDKCNGIPPPAPKKTAFKNGPVLATQAYISSAPPGPSQKRETLPNPHYASMKDNVLRKKLSENRLSTGGTRQAMEKRWSEYVILHNSNCDAKNPKSKLELQRYMESWERNQGQGRMTASEREGSQIKEKDFDGLAWAAKHEDTFKDLIANARKRVAKKADKPLQESNTPREAAIPLTSTFDHNPNSSLSTLDQHPTNSFAAMPIGSPPILQSAAGQMSLRNICNSPMKQSSQAQPMFHDEALPWDFEPPSSSQLQTPHSE